MRETKELLPTIRANKDDINIIFGLFAAIQEMEKARVDFDEQMKG